MRLVSKKTIDQLDEFERRYGPMLDAVIRFGSWVSDRKLQLSFFMVGLVFVAFVCDMIFFGRLRPVDHMSYGISIAIFVLFAMVVMVICAAPKERETRRS